MQRTPYFLAFPLKVEIFILKTLTSSHEFLMYSLPFLTKPEAYLCTRASNAASFSPSNTSSTSPSTITLSYLVLKLSGRTSTSPTTQKETRLFWLRFSILRPSTAQWKYTQSPTRQKLWTTPRKRPSPTGLRPLPLKSPCLLSASFQAPRGSAKGDRLPITLSISSRTIWGVISNIQVL